MRVLCVCRGNVHRSPLAEAAIRKAATEAGVELDVDSAGANTVGVGGPPSSRVVAAAAQRGLEVGGLSRAVTAEDFAAFDVILAMDQENFRSLAVQAPSDEGLLKVRTFREFDPAEPGGPDLVDPIGGSARDFSEVVEITWRTAVEFVRMVKDGEL